MDLNNAIILFFLSSLSSRATGVYVFQMLIKNIIIVQGMNICIGVR